MTSNDKEQQEPNMVDPEEAVEQATKADRTLPAVNSCGVRFNPQFLLYAAGCLVLLGASVGIGIAVSKANKDDDDDEPSPAPTAPDPCAFTSESLFWAIQGQPMSGYNYQPNPVLKNFTRIDEYEELCGPIGDWDVSRVTDMDMLFYCPTAVESPFEPQCPERFRDLDINRWNTSNVVTMIGTFQNNVSKTRPFTFISC